jgi:uncharacterized protein
MNVLILPGIGGSGPEHWQSRWEAANPDFMRVGQRDWDHPVRSDWTASLEEAVLRSGPETVLVAHSIGCLLVAHWAVSSRLDIHGALLVAVPDPLSPVFPPNATGFAPVPRQRLPFQSIVVASSNDPFGSVEFAGRCAASWGSRFAAIGDAGHINTAGGFGEWDDGLAYLDVLTAASNPSGRMRIRKQAIPWEAS